MLYQMFHWEDNHVDKNKLSYEWIFTELVWILV